MQAFFTDRESNNVFKLLKFIPPPAKHRETGKLMTGAKRFLGCLSREDVDCSFGYPGHIPFDDDLPHQAHRCPTRGECPLRREGYAYVTGKAGVCCATYSWLTSIIRARLPWFHTVRGTYHRRNE